MKQVPHEKIEEGSFIKLPDDLIYLISTHTTHFFDYWNLRLTCKKCQQAIPSIPEWRISNNRLPLFIFFKDDEDGLLEQLEAEAEKKGMYAQKIDFKRVILILDSKERARAVEEWKEKGGVKTDKLESAQLVASIPSKEQITKMLVEKKKDVSSILLIE